MRFKTQITSAIKWSYISQFGCQAIQIISTLVLARLLSPNDYGLLGMAMIFIGFVNIFRDMGLSAAIIHESSPSWDLLNSVFWFQFFFAFLCSLGLIVCAPLFAWFYLEPELTPILQLLALSFPLTSLGIVQLALLKKDLAFNTIALIDLTVAISSNIVGVYLAYKGSGVWALVYTNLTRALVSSCLLWGVNAWKPKFKFSWQAYKNVLNFSLYLTGYNIFNYLARNADYVIIGRFLGTQELGYYTMAYRIMLYPLRNITMVISRVLFPALSQIKDDNLRFRNLYVKVCLAIALVVFPLMMGLCAVHDLFVMTVLGPKWEPVAWLILILSPVGMIQSIGATVGTIYQAKGKTDTLFMWGISTGCFLTLCLFIGVNWGIIGVASAYLIVSIILVYPNFAIPFRFIELKVFQFAKRIFRALLSSVIMLIVVVTLKNSLTSELSALAELCFLVLFGGITYGLAAWCVNREQLVETINAVANRH